jgi:hypothetical protein
MLTQIATAVASEIATLPDVPAGACEFRYIHEWDPTHLSAVRIAVTPRGFDASNASRSVLIGDYRIAIVVAKRASTDADSSEVLGLAEAILMRLKISPVLELPNTAGRVVFNSASMDVGSEDALNEFNVYKASIDATFKVLNA